MIFNQVKRLIVKERLRFFFYETAFVFLLIFFISTIEWILLPFELNPEIFGTIFYIMRAVVVFLAIPTTIVFMEKLIPNESDLRRKLKISAFKSHFMLYKISKSNYKFQLLYGILLLFLVFIPLNFFLYLLIPEMVTYQKISEGLDLQNSYLFIDNFIIFLVLLILIQISIAIVEETIYRGFINKRGGEHFNRISAALISAYSYGFLSLMYYFDPIASYFSNIFPIIWFFALFFIGLILSLTTIRRKWLFPSIFAHSTSNIIMFSMIWCFNGTNYADILLYIYFPLLLISIILFIWQYKRIRESVSIGLGMFKIYLKNDEKEDEQNSDKYFRIIFDIIIGFLVFLIGLLITL
ncbi:MAG: CPBP family intramembrane metalloprotease [Promethearchaeota archaeon]|nr:MAG: CPBP family intramembrane metalloprotease [Candidatus Lokiarchaeota archaeon]